MLSEKGGERQQKDLSASVQVFGCRRDGLSARWATGDRKAPRHEIA
jgi:hypothetical protein